MPTTFVILGTPRSGTSLLSGILCKLGVFIGHRLMGANYMNPTGFFQDADFEEIYDRATSEFMPEWPYALPTERLAELEALVAARCGMGVDWSVKFSKSAHALADIVRCSAHDVRLLVTRRDPAHSRASFRPWASPDHCYIDRAQRAVISAMALSPLPALTVDYDALVDGSRSGVARIADYIGRPVTDEAVALVDPRLRRFG